MQSWKHIYGLDILFPSTNIDFHVGRIKGYWYLVCKRFCNFNIYDSITKITQV